MGKKANRSVQASNSTRSVDLRSSTGGKLEDLNHLHSQYHKLGERQICDTEKRGYQFPKALSRTELVLDATEGFIPLWEKNTTLRWRFQERSLHYREDKENLKSAIKNILGKAILKWGDSAPIKFAQREDAWDFEIAVRESDRCNRDGCVLASAFFPDSGQHELVIYPKLFEQNEKEQIDTLIHELGHVFGLRHFFADVSEKAWPVQIYGEHKPFSIMNYGEMSELTDADKKDLRRLYSLAWGGELTQVNGTPIKFVTPYHATGVAAEPSKQLTLVHRLINHDEKKDLRIA